MALTRLFIAFLFSVNLSIYASNFEATGTLGIETRTFFMSNEQSTNQASVYLDSELYWGWNNDKDSVTFKPFYRLDSKDDERSHGDIRELYYAHAGSDWELRLGIRKEFWGVTEFQHLVDVINQTDNVENLDGEDKLGQLMLNLSLVEDWGIIDFYVLPGFRERTFPGENGRLGGALTVDSSHVKYESNDKDKHVDMAIRWTHTFDNVDIGAYWFRGTNRAPKLIPAQIDESLQLEQYYDQMNQFGVDIQASLGDWLWKLESIYRDTQTDEFSALQAGFEYTFIGVFETNIDVGWLTEYSWDSRGKGSLIAPGSVFQNDLFFGSRIALNDVQGTSILLGISQDLDRSAYAAVLEASRRLGEHFTANIDLKFFGSSDPSGQLYLLRNDDYLEANIKWYF